MKVLQGIGVIYICIASIVGLYNVIYLRFVVCTKESILGFFSCPETTNPALVSIKALLWPLFYLI